ncbi:MAG: LysR family transcriptional regulator [Rhodospirillales bacterium]|jgi:hypothetical protein|nr:LysR family transcriptional regulator [Rhodospirillales bacterium]
MIDKLEYLLALTREQHFGHAAEACNVTQPTFSARAGGEGLDPLALKAIERPRESSHADSDRPHAA